MKRWLLIGGGVGAGLILVVVIVLFFVVSSLDSLIKVAVEKYGSEITQVDVRLKEAEVSVTSGQGALRGPFESAMSPPKICLSLSAMPFTTSVRRWICLPAIS